MQRQTAGNTTHAGMSIGGSNTPASPINGSGWQRAGNYGVNNQIRPGGLTFGAALEIPHARGKFNAEWRGFATKAAIGDGMSILFRNAAKLAGPLGVAVMVADMAGVFQGSQIGLNPDPATNGEKPFLVPEILGGYVWKGGFGNCESFSAMDAIKCSLTAQHNTTQWGQCSMDSQTTQSAVGGCIYAPTGTRLVGGASSVLRESYGQKAANWDEARPAFESMDPLPSEVSQKMIDWARKQDGQNGIEPFKISVQPIGVTGPSTLPPTTKEDVQTTVRPGADGRPETVQTTTRTTTETGVSYDGDKVKVTPKETTTTTTKVTDADGNVKETTETDTKETTESDTPKEETPGLCDLYPDILACAKPELDKPDTEIPREDRTITYEAENLFGEGACPADSMATLGTLQQTVKVWDWQKTCEYALPLRAIVLALASFAAFLIVMPGESRT